MAITHSISLQHSTGGNILSSSFSISSGQEIDISESVPDASADLAIAFAATLNKIQYLQMVSDQAITIEVNSSSAPSKTISLAAGLPLTWYSGVGKAVTDFLGASNVTGLFATNASGEDATFRLRALIDPT